MVQPLELILLQSFRVFPRKEIKESSVTFQVEESSNCMEVVFPVCSGSMAPVNTESSDRVRETVLMASQDTFPFSFCWIPDLQYF